jgi:hypothetical protein
MTCATVKSLMEIKDVTEDDAKLIREIWQCVGPKETSALLEKNLDTTRYANRDFTYALEQHNSKHMKRHAIDAILGTCGVEYLGLRKRNREHVYYCNTGESYAATVLFDGDHLRVNCWADLVERNLISERESF